MSFRTRAPTRRFPFMAYARMEPPAAEIRSASVSVAPWSAKRRARGFRAYSRETLYKLNPTTSFSYCMETIIQAGNKGLAITSIPIKINAKTRESRLFKSTGEHVYKSASAIVRAFIMYRPYVIFISIGSILFVIGAIPFVRYAYFVLMNDQGSHLQSLILGSILLIGSVLSFVLGVIADLVRVNRILAEQDLELAKHLRYDK